MGINLFLVKCRNSTIQDLFLFCVYTRYFTLPLKEVKELDYGDIKALYSNYSIKATVGTDSSGNNVASETVYFPKPFDSIDLNIENIESFSDTPVIDKLADTYYKVGIQVQGDVYKQSYAGYQFDSKYFFITTSLDSSVNLGLDTLDTKNITEE
ncbi:hypothetical protein [Streptococcus iniae]|uniref:hypothetical protein n=1 Tax=Streptococcus iniae TaxID=1346 RepID=UPI00217E4EEE|nr:hypothetical protein [Streptococcus iniae]WLR87528.1 hypothetical protein Q9317_09220 [Streptococcus iniae]WLR89452.1 hypothetical protein Q9318_08960 [Streptococcus iniae]